MRLMKKTDTLPDDDPRKIVCKAVIEKLGGYSAVARLIGRTPQAVFRWEVVPVDWCEKLGKKAGYTIYQLRPDIYGAKPRHARRDKKRGNSDVRKRPSPAANAKMDASGSGAGESDDCDGGKRLYDREGNGNLAQYRVGAH